MAVVVVAEKEAKSAGATVTLMAAVKQAGMVVVATVERVGREA